MRSSQFTCQICGVVVPVCPSELRKRKHCSKDCQYEAYRRKRGPETSQWNGGLVPFTCEICGKKKYVKRSQAIDYGRRFCSKICAGKAQSHRQSGENNPMWKGGISDPRDKEFASPEYKEWKTNLLARDNYSCQLCGLRSGNGNGYINLHAHHIKSWVNHPGLRFDLDNGRTFCRDCHIKIHSGNGNKEKRAVNP